MKAGTWAVAEADSFDREIGGGVMHLHWPKEQSQQLLAC